jgi:hypothetical protein
VFVLLFLLIKDFVFSRRLIWEFKSFGSTLNAVDVQRS